MKKYYDYQMLIGRMVIMEEAGMITDVYQSDSELSFNNFIHHDVMKEESAVIQEAYHQLLAYFEGKRKHFDLPLNPSGTAFQKKVWDALSKIPYGKTASYKEIATFIGSSNAARAVGNANNKNPIMIVIPCHRVIGSNKKLIGYGGGLEMKEELLRLEGAI